jgi:hypothetical protein
MIKVYHSPPNWPQPPQGWRPPPDWTPDPNWGPAPDGWNFWQEAPWADSEVEKPKKRRWLWPTAGAATLVAIASIVLLTGGKFGAVEVSTEGVRVEFENGVIDGKQASEQDVAAAQPQLEQQVADLEEQATQQPESGQTASLDISGVWQGDDGFTYTFEQYGAYLVWQEASPEYAVTAVGEGYAEGNFVYLEFAAFDGTTGYAELLFESGTLSGTATNAVATEVPISMRPLS